MKFNSQICTTKEQSERLLALGLKKETADMFYSHDKGEDIYAIRACWEDFWSSNKLIDGHIRRSCIPAWSLHRLIEMMPSFIDIGGYEYMLRIIQGRAFSYRSNIVGDALLYGCGSVYDSAIYTIEWLIGEGCFNKEYLE